MGCTRCKQICTWCRPMQGQSREAPDALTGGDRADGGRAPDQYTMKKEHEMFDFHGMLTA